MARLNQDLEMIERMELDLIAKTQTAYETADMTPAIHGVFSIDDLENKSEADLCQKLAVGVGYEGAEPHSILKTQGNVGSNNAAKAVDFIFRIILAVPTGPECTERFSATKLLTILRLGILGSTVAGDITNRTWEFVREYPNIQESTETMLYYSQVWRVELIATGQRS